MASRVPFVLMPAKRLGMGELEARVLDALWDDGGWLTAADVHAVVGRRRRLAYTTVMTVLVRLYEKGLLERRLAGRAYAYHPVQSREERTAARIVELLATAGDQSVALSCFLTQISGAERARLRRLLEGR